MSKARRLLVAAVVVAVATCPVVTEVHQPTAAASVDSAAAGSSSETLIDPLGLPTPVYCLLERYCSTVEDSGNVRTYTNSLWSAATLQASSTILKLSNAEVAYGEEQAERLEVTVSPQSSGSMPTGTVWIVQFAQTFCSAKLTSGKGSCTLSRDQLAPGVYHVVATYGGSADYNGSASAQETFTVTKATSKITLKLSPAKVAYGKEQAERLEVTVSPQSSGSMPTGTVAVNAAGTTLCTSKLTSGNGSCTLSRDQLAPGVYHVVATYGGSADYNGSASAQETFTVTKATSKITLKLSPAKVAYGKEQAERLEVTVSPQSSGSMPTGTVAVISSAGTLCVIKLSLGQGSCRLTPKKLKVRTYLLVATYGGSMNFETSTSVKKTLTVTKTATQTTTIPGTRVVLNFEGSGGEDTSQFTISASAKEWVLGWAYNCSNFGSGTGNFSYFVYFGPQMDINDMGPNQLGNHGSGEQYYYDTGTFYLQVNSECLWAVRATEVN